MLKIKGLQPRRRGAAVGAQAAEPAVPGAPRPAGGAAGARPKSKT